MPPADSASRAGVTPETSRDRSSQTLIWQLNEFCAHFFQTMKPLELTRTELRILLVLAFFGALIPNGVFLYYFFSSPETTKIALTNPISLVFIIEAFILMFLFAWLLRKMNSKMPSGRIFVVMSLLGTMVFSIPVALYLMLKEKRK